MSWKRYWPEALSSPGRWQALPVTQPRKTKASNSKAPVRKATPSKAAPTKTAETKAETKVEETKADAKVEATKANATKVEATKADATKADATKADATKADATKTAESPKGPPTDREGMTRFWDDVYAKPDYVYGEAADAYFARQLAELSTGRILLPAEGEGRNAVHAAREGWWVDAFDLTTVGREKALALAAEHEVTIDYVIAGLEDYRILPATYDAVALLYAHAGPAVREAGFRILDAGLKPGGVLIVEAFARAHADTDAPFGPKNPDLCYAEAELREAFPGYEWRSLATAEVELDHGRHTGRGVVVRGVAVKRG